MKKLVCISAFVVLTFSSCVCSKYADPQEDTDLRWKQSDLTLTARGNYSTSKQGDNKESELKINPCVGYFLSDQVELGLGAKYMANKTDYGSSEDKWNSFTVGPYFRYYYCPEWRLQPFLEADVNYTKINYNTADYTQSGVDASLGLGLTYKVNNWFALTASYAGINYQSLSDDRESVDNYSSFGAKFNTKNLRLGGIIKLN